MDRAREATIVSEHATAAEAFAEIDRLAAQMVRTGRHLTRCTCSLSTTRGKSSGGPEHTEARAAIGCGWDPPPIVRHPLPPADGCLVEREREARAARRNDEDRIRHLSSQLEILTELQKAVDEFGRTAAMMSNANRRAYKDTGEWKKNVYGHELDQRAHQSERRTLLLGAQVDDAEVMESPAGKHRVSLTTKSRNPRSS